MIRSPRSPPSRSGFAPVRPSRLRSEGIPPAGARRADAARRVGLADGEARARPGPRPTTRPGRPRRPPHPATPSRGDITRHRHRSCENRAAGGAPTRPPPARPAPRQPGVDQDRCLLAAPKLRDGQVSGDVFDPVDGSTMRPTTVKIPIICPLALQGKQAVRPEQTVRT